MFCVHCKVIDLSRKSFEESPNHTGIGLQHLFLGCHSAIKARADAGCPGCKSILACCDHNISIVVEYVKDKCGLRGDYGVSIHIEYVQPRLYVLLGDPPGLEGINQDATQRRANFMSYCGFQIFSTTNRTPSEDRGRLFDPSLVDKELLKSWITRCDCSHGLECQGDDAMLQNLISSPRPSLSFIDVETQCIVTLDTEVPYVALSYVWGQVPSIMALKENIAELKKPGSLSLSSQNTVPQTIRDSMTLCSLIGQRYLWVDRLCIVQDDLENKMASIDAMAWIYAQATLTIVAAQGTDADFGLPGISEKHIEAREKHILTFFSGPMLKGSMWLHRTDDLDRKPWSKRGWTLQENLFSRRLLIMDDIITWRCRSATWIEGLECFDERQKIEPVHLHSTTKPQKSFRDTKLSVPSWPSLIDYGDIVHAFNTRTLTFDSDTLNAFAGTLKAMTPYFPSGFYAGLPEFYFDIALLWQAHRGLRPRFSTDAEKDGNHFPSWSWAGWMGSLRLDASHSCFDAEVRADRSAIKISNMVEWFKDPSYRERIENSYHISRDTFQNVPAKMDLPPGWEYHKDEETKAVYYTYPSLSQVKRFNYPIYTEKRLPAIAQSPHIGHHFLYFRTSRAYFTFLSASKTDPPSRLREVKDPKTGEFHYVQDLTIINPRTSDWAGEIRLTLSEKDYPQPLRSYENCELIVISKGETSIVGKGVERHSFHEVSDQVTREIIMRNGQNGNSEKIAELYRFYFVLWIVRGADGVAYRRGLGRVWEKAWENGVEVANIDLVLG